MIDDNLKLYYTIYINIIKGFFMNIEQNSNISKEEYMEFYLAEDQDTIEKLLNKMGKKTLKDKYMFLYSLMGFSETYNCENLQRKLRRR